MGAIAPQITSLMIVYSTVYSGAVKKTSKLRVTDLCAGEFPAHMASNAEKVSIWWRHHVYAEDTYGIEPTKADHRSITSNFSQLHRALSSWRQIHQ